MLRKLSSAFNLQQSGLVLIILLLGVILTAKAGTHVDRITGHTVNNFLNASTLMQVATDASFFAIMAVGMTMVIISGGIDLSVGSTYALSGVLTALILRKLDIHSHAENVLLAIGLCAAFGAIAGLLNGVMITGLQVHPFIITLGTMWIFRGIAFVATNAQSILLPPTVTDFTKASLGLGRQLYPMPLIFMVVMTMIGSVYLLKTVAGRRIFAVGGNVEASRYSGLPLNRVLIGVYVIAGLCAGIAAFVGSSFYGSATSSDGNGYELYVIASAVVGGTSLSGGKGTALGAMLGALLITLIQQSINTLGLDQNYEWIIIGCATIVAVVLDRMNARMAAKRAVQARAA